MHDTAVKWTVDEIRDPQIVRAFDVRRRIFRRDHDDGYVFDPMVFIHDRQNFEPVHFGHNDIQ